MSHIDTRLLLLFQAIYQHSSISKAAVALNIGQPAVSLSLNQLRSHFNDPLFVRIGNAMQPTQTAQELLPLVEAALQQIQLVNDFSRGFDPLTANREFHISMTDISHLNVLPGLLAYFNSHAPQVRLRISPITSATPAQMSEGEIDLAIGYIPQLEAGFYQQTLFQQRYVILASEMHSRLQKGTLTLEQYQQELHIDVSPVGTGHYMIANELHKQHIERHIAVRLPNYMGVDLLVKQTELLAIVPKRLSTLLMQYGGIQILPLPFDLSGYGVKQHWHERMHLNADNQWLRQVCFGLLHI